MNFMHEFLLSDSDCASTHQKKSARFANLPPAAPLTPCSRPGCYLGAPRDVLPLTQHPTRKVGDDAEHLLSIPADSHMQSARDKHNKKPAGHHVSPKKNKVSALSPNLRKKHTRKRLPEAGLGNKNHNSSAQRGSWSWLLSPPAASPATACKVTASSRK